MSRVDERDSGDGLSIRLSEARRHFVERRFREAMMAALRERRLALREPRAEDEKAASHSALLLAGQAASFMNEPEIARALYKRVLVEQPSAADAIGAIGGLFTLEILLGETRERAGHLRGARAAYLRAIRVASRVLRFPGDMITEAERETVRQSVQLIEERCLAMET
jgi:hypothetical protein